MALDRDTLDQLLDTVERFVRERLRAARGARRRRGRASRPRSSPRCARSASSACRSRRSTAASGSPWRRRCRSPSSSGATSPAFRSLHRHQQRHRLAGHRHRRHARSRSALAAAPRLGRDHRLVRADRARCRLRRRRRCTTSARRDGNALRPQRHQALHHQRAGGRALHGDGAHRSRRARARGGISRVPGRGATRRASRSASPTGRWASRARRPAT